LSLPFGDCHLQSNDHRSAQGAHKMTNTNEQLSAEDGITADIAQFPEAISTKNLVKYGSSVTTDFVNMSKNFQYEMAATVSREARLDALKILF